MNDMNITQKSEIFLYLNDPIIIDLHEHPLIFCLTPDRKNFGINWNCNKCNNKYSYNTPSFYCTFCDFDLCTNCLGFYQLNQIKILNNSFNFNFNTNNTLYNSFKWQKISFKHEHMLTLIEKLNKNYKWKCRSCDKEYDNNNIVFYCSLCDFLICHYCVNNNNDNIFTNINNQKLNLPSLNNNDNNSFQIKSFQMLNNLNNNFDNNNKESNIIYSPLSLQIIFSLLANCITPGIALDEIMNAFYINNLDLQNQKIINIISNINSNLKIGNALYCNNNIASYISQNFKNFLSLYSSVFASNIYDLNNFISQKTENKVNNYFNNSDLFESNMIMANVLYFNSQWKKKFETCDKMRFYVTEYGSYIYVPMMKCKTNFKYYQDDSIQAIEIPYELENTSAIILLPNKNVYLDDLIFYLTQNKLNILYDKFQYEEVELIMPKFKFLNQNIRMDLIKMLKSLGITKIFENSDKNFIPLLGTNYFKINKVFQTNLINVDENGTQLISISSVGGFFGSTFVKNISMIVDRPFLFFIRNSSFEIGKDLILISVIKDFR